MVFCNNSVDKLERSKLWTITKKLRYVRRRWRISWRVFRRLRLTPKSSKYPISRTIDGHPIFAHEVARRREIAETLQGAVPDLAW